MAGIIFAPKNDLGNKGSALGAALNHGCGVRLANCVQLFLEDG